MSGRKRKRTSDNAVESHAGAALSMKPVLILRSPDGTFACFLLPDHQLVASCASPRALADWALHEQGAKRVEHGYDLSEWENQTEE